jgi:hypothetical protein
MCKHQASISHMEKKHFCHPQDTAKKLQTISKRYSERKPVHVQSQGLTEQIVQEVTYFILRSSRCWGDKKDSEKVLSFFPCLFIHNFKLF